MEQSLINYTLHLADNALVLGHRNSEWTGHGPLLEQDIAISNIAVDLIGQSRNLYQYAAELIGNGRTEDSLAYLRGPHEFRNFLIVEQERGDWAKTMLRQFFFSAYQYPLYQQMQGDDRLMAVAEKSFKEVTYHLRWSSEWVIRLGQGTEESHKRMTKAINELWPYTGEMLTAEISEPWNARVTEILAAAGIEAPQKVQMKYGGTEGRHTKHLEQLLEEMQYMQRTYPGVEW